MGHRATILLDDLRRLVPREAVSRSPSPERWLIEPMDGSPVLIATGSRAPDLVLSHPGNGTHEVFICLCSPDGHSSTVEVRIGPEGPFTRLRWEGREIDYREISLGVHEVTSKEVVLRHPPGERSCLAYVRLEPR